MTPCELNPYCIAIYTNIIERTFALKVIVIIIIIIVVVVIVIINIFVVVLVHEVSLSSLSSSLYFHLSRSL